VARKILRFSYRIPPCPGGKEQHVRELTRRQVLRGDEVTTFFRLGDRYALSGRSHGIKASPTWNWLPGTACQFSFSLAALVASRGSERDVVHIHGDHTEAFLLSRVGRFLRHSATPIVLTAHGRLNRKQSRWAAAAYPYVDAFIALGSGTAEDLMWQGVDPQRIAVMSSGVDLGMAERVRNGTRVEAGRVVTVGSLISLKNFETVIEAFHRINTAHNHQLVIVGDGPNMERLRSMAAGNPAIKFRGHLTKDEVYVEVAQAQLFVMPSLKTATVGEGVPTALLEAMALGKHCIVSDQALPEPVVSDHTSYERFDPRDAVQLSALLLDGISDLELSLRRGEQARTAVAHLDWSSVADRVEDVYLQAEDSAARRRGRVRWLA
jgi:glycosyltransferase involved in cell wall biosynthesis